jgi:hypothetical protein
VTRNTRNIHRQLGAVVAAITAQAVAKEGTMDEMIAKILERVKVEIRKRVMRGETMDDEMKAEIFERVKSEIFARVFQGDVPRTWATDAPLDPRNADATTLGELHELADRPEEEMDSRDADLLVKVPRIPINAAEARRMMGMINCIADGTMYAGYTNDELAVLPGGAQISVIVNDTPFQ